MLSLPTADLQHYGSRVLKWPSRPSAHGVTPVIILHSTGIFADVIKDTNELTLKKAGYLGGPSPIT